LLVLLLPFLKLLLLLQFCLSHVIVEVLHSLAEVLVIVDVSLLMLLFIFKDPLLVRLHEIDDFFGF